MNTEVSSEPRPQTWLRLALFLTLFSLATWSAGFVRALIERGPQIAVPEEGPENFGVYAEAWHIVESEFYGELPDQTERAIGSIDGLLESLGDPYAAFFPAGTEPYEAGPVLAPDVGLWLRRIVDGLLVVTVVENSPAAKAGIVPGDRIFMIDETEVAASAGLESLEQLEGWVGSELELVVGSESRPPTRLSLSRKRLNTPGFSSSEPEEGVLLIQLRQIDDSVLDAFHNTVKEKNGSYTELILDLRNNPGGSYDAARELISILYDGKAWKEIDRAGGEFVLSTRGREHTISDVTPLPQTEVQETLMGMSDRMIVLINEGTAGAAEALAASIQGAFHAEFFGSNSFSMTDFQELHRLSDGSQLRLTLKHWEGLYTGPLEDSGLEATYQVSDMSPLEPKAEGSSTDTVAERDSASDPVLAAALAYLGTGDWESYLDANVDF